MTTPGQSPRVYTAEEKAEAVALAASIGPRRAALKLGMPPRTVANWTHHPASSAVIAAAEASIAQRLEAAHSEALDAVMGGLRDPGAKLGDKATALRVLGEQLQLARGRATQNVNLQTVNSEADWERTIKDVSDATGVSDWDIRASLANIIDASVDGEKTAAAVELLRGGRVPDDRETLMALARSLATDLGETI